MHGKCMAERCWPFLMFLGIQVPDSWQRSQLPQRPLPFMCLTMSSEALLSGHMESRAEGRCEGVCHPVRWDGWHVCWFPPSLLTCHLLPCYASSARLRCKSPSSVLWKVSVGITTWDADVCWAPGNVLGIVCLTWPSACCAVGLLLREGKLYKAQWP